MGKIKSIIGTGLIRILLECLIATTCSIGAVLSVTYCDISMLH